MHKVYIPCCDASLPVVKVSSYLYNKFWKDCEVHYLGFSKPDFEFYNENHHFHSMAKVQEGGAAKWTRYIHDFLKGVEDEHLIFSLDDFWLCEEPNRDMLEIASKLLSGNDKFGRFDLTFDSQVEGNIIKLREESGYSIAVKKPGSEYRVSTQPAIWNKQFLLEILDHDWNPWQFEITGNNLANSKYPNKFLTLCFEDKEMKKYPLRTIAKGSVSRHQPGKTNVLGMSIELIEELISESFVNEDDLIWGMWAGKVPSFEEKGGRGFHPGFLEPHPTSKTNFKEYYCVYDDKEFPMLEVNLWDNSFSHTLTHPDYGYISTQATPAKRGKKIKFVPKQYSYEGITLFTDHMLKPEIIENVKSKVKVGWILEPPVIHSWVYDKIPTYINKLDYLLTFSDEIAKKYDNAIVFPWCSIRLDGKDWGVHKKTKKLSLIASSKRYAPGHILRHKVVEELSEKHKIDLWGSGYNKLPQHGKVTALKDYMFSVVIQNCKMDTFFTDFVDPLIVGTIPIFWGTKKVSNFFNTEGIIFFDSLEELDHILTNLTEKDYYDRIEAVKENYETAKKFWRSDDQLGEILHRIMRGEYDK